jgi:hypothetical protein
MSGRKKAPPPLPEPRISWMRKLFIGAIGGAVALVIALNFLLAGHWRNLSSLIPSSMPPLKDLPARYMPGRDPNDFWFLLFLGSAIAIYVSWRGIALFVGMDRAVKTIRMRHASGKEAALTIGKELVADGGLEIAALAIGGSVGEVGAAVSGGSFGGGGAAGDW